MEISNYNRVEFLKLTAELALNADELKAKAESQTDIEDIENEVYYKLTPSDLLEYGEDKEQYLIIDMSQKVYVKPEDAENYISATNLMEFLGEYGIVDYEAIQASYDKLYSTDVENLGLATQIEEILEEKPTATSDDYWSDESVQDSAEAQLYTSMYDKIIATLDNIANYYCSCCFNAIAEMLSYTDAMTVTNDEIYDAAIAVGMEPYMTFDEPETSSTTTNNAVASNSAEESVVENVVTEEASEAETEAEVATSTNTTSNTTSILGLQDNLENVNVIQTSISETSSDDIETTDEIIQEATVADNTSINITHSTNATRTTYTSSIGASMSIPVWTVSISTSSTSNTSSTDEADEEITTSDNNLSTIQKNTDAQISNARNELYVAERLERLDSSTTLEAGMVDLSNLSSDAQKLFSNYEIDSDGNYVLSSMGERRLKTLEQKVVDIYYIAMNYSSLDVEPGLNEQDGVKNSETDTTVKGGIKSIEKDIQIALGVEGFDLEKYKSDYSDWSNRYIDLAQAYDSEVENLKQLQNSNNTEEKFWYVNLWDAMGGRDTNLGEEVKTDIQTSSATHGHARGQYSNELGRTFSIPENVVYKNKDNYNAMTVEDMTDSQWLPSNLDLGDIRLEKVVNNKPKTLSKEISTSTSEDKVIKTNYEKELEKSKELMKDDTKYDNLI
ncbi:MAG: hypothetical protein R3Y28_05655 [Candidatus Gastranaerophilales bacterium]